MKKCLIADDDPLLMLGRLLTGDFARDVAANGAEAVELCALALGDGEQYDLITLDIMMPVLDGSGAPEEVRDLEAAHGVKPERNVMLTALDDQGRVATALYRHDATAFISRPIDRVGPARRLAEPGA